MLKPVKTKNGFHLLGRTGKLIDNFEQRWLLTVPETNPAIITCFKERDKKPYRPLLPWSGEFAGKYITGTYYVYNITHNEELKKVSEKFIFDLIDCMDTDGYLGCFKQGNHLTGRYNNGDLGTWDTWAHYHIMYGFYLWNLILKKDEIDKALYKMADLFINTFYNGKMRMKETGSTEMNLSPLHIFALLYLKTGKKKYLDFAKEIEEDIESPECGGYVSCMDSGNEFYRCRKPRWESLHPIMGINSLEECCNDPRYGETAEKVFYSILRTDVHNTGGFSTGEQACGTPFINDPIELCCVIAFNALASEVYLKRPSVKIADFLERSYYNAIMGSYSPSGRWSTYNTPMEGVKRANYDWIVFQSRAGSPDLNCCSANSGRGLGQLSTWAYAEDGEDFYINLFEKASFETESGMKVKIRGDYPVKCVVNISVESDKKRRILIRVPEWADKTNINGKTVPAGEYYPIEMDAGKIEIRVRIPLKVRFERGRLSYKGFKSWYYGPILFGADMSVNDGDLAEIPKLKLADFKRVRPVRDAETGRITMKLNNGVTLVDFYMLGQSGSEYRTWL